MADNKVHADNASSTLNGAITDSATTITVNDASSFASPTGSQFGCLTISDGTNTEIIYYTGITSNDLTGVTRAQEGTSNYAFADGVLIQDRITSDDVDRKIAEVGDYTPTGAWDFGGATSLEVPNGTTTNVTVNGQICVDILVTDFSHGILKYYSGEELGVVSMPIAQFTTPTDGYVVSYNASNDEFELVAQSGGGGTPGGSNTEIQYNNSGSFAGLSTLTTDGTDLDFTGSFTLGESGAAVSSTLDEDDMSSDSATALATQQSIKAYVDDSVGGAGRFSVYCNTAQVISDSTFTKVQLDTETEDVDSFFDSTTNYRFTPTTAGVYLFVGSVQINAIADQSWVITQIFKNGSALSRYATTYASGSANTSVPATAFVSMNGSTDYIELYCYHEHGSNRTIQNGSAYTFLTGIRLSD